MRLKELQSHWNRFGETDPLWAIASDPQKRHNRWDRREFFHTGEVEIAVTLDYLASLGVPLRRGQALDFGCGVGRLSQALALHFEQVRGVDIAPSMLRLAEEYNAHGPRVRYVLNDRDDLSLFADGGFDFIYSNIVLQHIRPPHAKRYVREFLRLLAPGGHLIFQLPSHLLEPEAAAPRKSWMRARLGDAVRPFRDLAQRVTRSLTAAPVEPIMEMHGVPRPEVEALIADAGGRLLDVQEHPVAGPQWLSYRYCVAR